MRLTSIKLSGFKSFVDPTTIQIQGQLVGVVGPNGCGKSNIIDAVRWVLGESRASELRGESMRDVIFNGTTERKSSGRASVELAFDNDDDRVFGQWGRYDELAVRRVLTREGGSSYHINNMNVRRRDIQDIFMGTGLGPRAYAIIGQGMIARIIEARPEELRVFLEEAAGVSKYRERRRETENRLQDTRENLTRVSDILREINQSLEKLEEQAVVAEKYYALQKEQDEKQKLFWLLEKKNAEEEHARLTIEAEKAKTALEAMNADVVRHDGLLEALRQQHAGASDELHAAQGALYQTNASIGSLEAEIRYVIESRNRLQAQIGSYTQQKEQWQSQEQTYLAELETANARLVDLAVSCEAARRIVVQLAGDLPGVEETWRQAQATCSQLHDQALQVRQQIALSSASHKNITGILTDLSVRRERLVQEKSGMDAPDEAVFQALQEELAEKEIHLQQQHERLALLQDSHPDLEEKRRVSQEQVERRSAELAQTDARLSALIQIQERSQAQGETESWLKKYELADLPPVWRRLQVEQGWEMALESVLSDRIFAREMSRLEWVDSFMSDPPASKLSFFTTAQAGDTLSSTVGTEKDKAGLTPFFSLLRLQDQRLAPVLSGWMRHVFVAHDMKDALARRQILPEGACFVLPQGHLVDRQSVRFYAPESEKEGMFARQQEIENLSARLQDGQKLLQDERIRLMQCESDVTQCNREMQGIHQRATELTRELHAIQLQVVRQSELRDRYLQRHTQIESVLAGITGQENEQREMLAVEEVRMEELDASLADMQSREEAARDILLEKESDLAAFRVRIRESERAAQEAEFSEKSLKNRIGELTKHIETAREQATQMSANVQQGQLTLQDLNDKVAQDNLQVLLDQRLDQEKGLAKLRQNLETVAQQLREAQEQRMGAEKNLQPQRDLIVSMQLKEQAARINVEQFSQKLEESGADIAALGEMLHPGLRSSSLQGEVTRLSNAIAALGAVNLAAAGELSETQQRRNFLEEQHADLNAAIETLEDAIRRIDGETRALLQGTFDQVNGHLSEVFPMLFGGGQASLIMTGDEILDAGVQIMVQPPGKKNVTIHLLSGGEKALAAIALVFSLFQLNPAPFCLLDEVDAPLDDANTERFCNMVKRMSAKTQFVFISHNKIAMEMAQQLIGVTMQEKGVSRIVSVDIEKATEFSNEVQTA
ncbi:chromosome segregation protein SMC [Oxalobacter vibrioformis]|uniref:Chromosome partition protein Smc n=1 Tax=Oxalobacter vibrioformis TaxID=933080 RepID=A0A9E9P349_9BURK|nr:chromosome segregation protein SMC [Oxalobacter vibrioformis]WAW10619.1 chromosome segregation protein SMC [Oxalobacter vibrioformis]